MTVLTQAFAAPRGGVFTTARTPADVARLAGDHGWRTCEIDLAGVDDEAALMRRMAEALELPDWFGHNWDALADSLRDVTADPGVALVLSNDQHLPQDVRDTAYEVLGERARDEQAPFVVALVRPARDQTAD